MGRGVFASRITVERQTHWNMVGERPPRPVARACRGIRLHHATLGGPLGRSAAGVGLHRRGH